MNSRAATIRAVKELLGAVHGRTVRPTHCHSCKAVILAGLDADECATWAVVDWTPLTATTELEALMQGRRTYVLARRNPATAPTLHLRDRWTIRGHRPGTPWAHLAADVVPEHRCGQRLPGAPTYLIHATSSQEATECPY